MAKEAIVTVKLWLIEEDWREHGGTSGLELGTCLTDRERAEFKTGFWHFPLGKDKELQLVGSDK